MQLHNERNTMKTLLLGAVAYDPKVVLIWDIIRDYANAYAKDKQMEIYWDAGSGQNVAELDTEENLQKMWLEDEQSLTEKLKLIDTYQLAGGAFWKLGFEDKTVWSLIGQYI